MTATRLMQRLLCSTALELFPRVAAPDGGGSAITASRRRGYHMLEARVMFDAAAADFALDAIHTAVQTQDSSVDRDHDLLMAALDVGGAVDAPVIDPGFAQVAFVDGSLDDIDTLIAGIGPGIDVYILDPTRDGVAQIAEIMGGYENVSAVHILSHGEAGALQLGSAVLTASSITGSHADEMATLGAALTSQADILIYGCDFGAGESGASAVAALASATGADVSASDDLTGADELGGDWILETQQGTIETGSLQLQSWDGVLTLVNTGNWSVSGTTATNTTSGITTTITMTPTTGGTVTLNGTPQTFNPATGLFANGAEGDPSLGFTFTWDTTPEPSTGVPQPDASTDDAPMTVTITFSQPVTNPIINIDRLGGNGTYDPNTATVGGEDSRSNSSLWTLTTPGATMVELAGVGHFDVTATTFQRTPNQVMDISGISGEASANALNSTAAGSVQVMGTFTTLTFVVSGVGVEGAGADGIEIGLTVDAAPNANNDAFSMNEDATLTGNLFANNGSGADTDINGDALTITQINGASFTVGTPITLANGTLTITNATTGAFTFTPNAHYVGGQPFTYTISDANGGTDTATASITINSVNDAPAGTDLTLTTAEDTPVALTAASFGFSDPNDSPANSLQSVIITTLPTTGTLTLGGVPVLAGQNVPAASLASLLWTPAVNSNGSGISNFTFQVVDTGGTANGGLNTDQTPNTITFNVSAVNDPPLVDNDGNNSSGQPGFNYETTYVENAPSVPVVDADITITDIDSTTLDVAVITLTNAFPLDSLQVGSMPIGIAAMIDTSVPGVITVTLTGPGTLADFQTAIQSVRFLTTSENPDPTDRIVTVTVNDGFADSNVATSIINVVPVNDNPTLDLDGNNSSGVNAGNFLTSYTENAPPTSIGDVDTTILDLDDTNIEGATITLTNGKLGDLLSIGTLPAGITIVGVPPTALAVDGTLTITLTGSASLADYQAAIEAIGFSSNSDNIDPTTRTVTVVVTDGNINSNTATASITIIPVNDAPIPQDPANPGVSDDAMPPQTGTDSSALTPFNVQAYFSDPDNTAAQLTFSLGPNTPSWMSLDAGGNIVGTPPADASQNTNVVSNPDGTYTITVIATDPAGLTGETTITYTISNPAPDAIDDSFGAVEDGADVTGSVFTANPTTADNDPDGDVLTVTAVAGAGANVGAATVGSTGGLFTISSTGGLTFDDNGAFDDLAVGETRVTTITYTITDGEGGFDTATISVTVTGSNDGPVIVSGSEIPDQVGNDNQVITNIDVTGAFADADTSDMLTYSATGLPLGLTLDPNTGIISGTLDPSASQNGNTGAPTNGVYTIVVTADDGNGGTVTDTFTYTVSNPAPLAQDDALATDEDTALTGLSVFANNGSGTDSDPDGDTPLTVTQVNGVAGNVGTAVAGSSGGTFTITSTGGLSFDPGADFQYLDDGETATTTVTYQISDGEGGFDVATVEVTVTGVNDAPIPVDPTNPGGPADPNDYIPDQTGTDGVALTPFDTSVYFADPDTSDTLSYSSPDLPSWMNLDPSTGVITGTPPLDASTGGPGSNGVYPITITVSDGDETFTTTLDYTIGNLPPDAVDDAYNASEDTVLPVPVGSGLIDSNDTDGDGDALDVTQLNGAAFTVGVPVALPSGALLTLNVDGSFSYDPNGAFETLAAGENGTDSFTYQVADGDGAFDTATVTITIAGANDAPIAEDDALGITENGTPVTGNVFVGNGTPQPDRDVDASDVLTVTQVGGNAAGVGTAVSGSVGGLFTIDANGNLVFDDNGAFEDLDDGETRDTTVTYTISDGNGGFDDAVVTITVTGVNDAPVPVDPTDPTGPADPNDFIPDVTTTDGATPVDPNVAQYFVDPEDDPLTFTAAGLPLGLTMAPDGSISGTIDPDASQGGNVPGQPGVYLVTVSVSDGSAVTTTTLTYTVTNPPPVAVDDTSVVTEDTPVSGNVLTDGVDDADGAPDSDPLVVTQFVVDGTTYPAGSTANLAGVGTLVINGDGSYTFTPAPNYDGPVPVATYTISDGDGGTDEATLALTITPVNDAPVVIDPTNPGTPLNPTEAPDPANIIPDISTSDGATPTDPNVAQYFADPEGDTLTFTATGLPAGLTMNPDGTITGTVNADASQGGPANDGVYLVTITADDGNGGVTTTTVTYTVTNPPPVAVDDTNAVTEDTPVSGNVLTDGVDDADGAPDSDPLVVTQFVVDGTTYPAGSTANLAGVGTLVINTDGSYTFTPAPNYDGPVPVATYTISDGNGGTDEATLSLSITSVNDPPAFVGPTPIPGIATTDGATPTDPNVAQYFTDADGDPLTFTASGLPTGLIMNPDGTITGTIDPDASQGGPASDGVYVVTVTADDGNGGVTTTTVTYTVTNPPPVAADDVSAGDEDSVQSGNVLLNDADTAPDSDPVVVTQFVVGGTTYLAGSTAALPGIGTLVINADGSFTFTPSPNYDGPVPVATYTVSDGNGGTDEATLTLSITPVNDPPEFTGPNPIPGISTTDGATPADPNVSQYFADAEGDTLTFTAVGLPPGLEMGPDGTIAGAVDPDASQGGPANDGVYLVTIMADDGNGGVTTTTVTYTVTNPPPVAADDAVTVAEDAAPLAGNVIAPVLPGEVADADTAPDSDVLTVIAADQAGSPITIGVPFTTAGGGVLTLNSDGSYTFVPGTAYNGLDDGETAVETISYLISDGNGGTDMAVLVITVAGANDAPVPVDPTDPGDPDNPNPADPNTIVPVQSATDGEDFPAGSPLVDLGPYVVDPDGEPVTFSTTSALPAGLTLNPDGTVTGSIDPDASQGGDPGNPGVYTIIVEASDGTTSTPITLTIDVSNLAPVAVDDTNVVTEDTPVSGNVLTDGVDDADGAPDSDPLVVTQFVVDGTTYPAGTTANLAGVGTLVINGDGSYTFTPAPNYDGPVPVATYTISDGNGGTDEATLSLSITPVNDAPVVIDPANPGTPLNPTEAPDPANIIPDISTTDGATPTDPNVAQYFADPEGDTLTFTATGLPTGLTMNPDGTITGAVDPDASQGGPANDGVYLVTITADDGNGGVTTTTVTYTVTNPLPVAVDDVALVSEDGPGISGSVISDPNTGDADAAPDSDSLTVTLADQVGTPISIGVPFTTAGGGVLTLNADGSYSFNPGTAYNGLDVGETATETISYTIDDGNGGVDTATLTITIVGANDGPVVVDPSDPIDPSNPEPAENPDELVGTLTGVDGATPPPLNVSSYFVDPDGESLSFAATGLPLGLVIDPTTGIISGTLSPDASQSGPGGDGIYKVVVTATDPDGATTTLELTYDVSNPPPVASGEESSDQEDDTQSGNVLANDVDGAPDSDALNVSAVEGGTVGGPITLTHGTLVLNADGTWTFTPNAVANALAEGETVTELVTYTVSDGQGGTDTAVLEIEIVGTNDVPVATVLPDQSNYEGNVINIDAGSAFNDPDGDSLTFTATGLPPGLSIDPATGVITGTIANGAANGGPYTITVTADDGHGGTVSAIFEWTVLALPVSVDPPGDPTPDPKPPVDHQPLAPLDPVVLSAVNTLKPLGGIATLTDWPVTQAVAGLGSLNSGPVFEAGDHVITKVVEWLERQGRDANWLQAVFDDFDHSPYAGDSLDLALAVDDLEVFRVKSVIVDGAMFIGIDVLDPRADVSDVHGAGQRGLPAGVALIDAQNLVVNVDGAGEWLDLTVHGRLADGTTASWNISINTQSGEIISGLVDASPSVGLRVGNLALAQPQPMTG